MKLSGIILSKNEEKSIVRAIESLEFCDEVVVIDDESEDNTSSLAEKAGARVIIHSLDGNFSTQRNFAISEAKGEWVLFVDADEQVSKELEREIVSAIKDGKYSGYFLVRTDYWNNKKLVGKRWGKAKILRLAKRDAGRFVRKIHETWEVSGKVGILSGELRHFPHQSVYIFVEHTKRYSMMHARELEREGKRCASVKTVVWPPVKLFWNYTGLGGYKDGVEGFIYSVLMSFHSFLAWSQYYLSTRKK